MTVHSLILTLSGQWRAWVETPGGRDKFVDVSPEQAEALKELLHPIKTEGTLEAYAALTADGVILPES